MDKREKLLAAALNLFVEFGFHDTPTSKIAKEAGIASGTLFYFFPTKDELVKTLYIDIKSRLNGHISETIKDEKSLQGILKGYYSATLHWALKHKTEFRFIEQFNSSPYLKQIAEEEIQKHIKPIIALLKNGIKDKIIKPLDVDLIFILLSGHTFSSNHYLVAKQFSKPKQEKVINDTFDLLWDMIT
ncbi:TetR/AcrR family transcriptional regulator [Flavobacterium sp. ZS1P14]|uniref:TetR/AcrR family transcriptional regulator n=1 Tax=Flavobacterium sp. ZS1P14 TaxID=3401729 RepID=UPI003AACFF7A